MASWLSSPAVWLVTGFAGQILFGSRFLVQWIVSERHQKVMIPGAFWYLSLGGGVLLLAYAIHRQDPVFAIGQAAGLVVYSRNLMLRRRSRVSA